MLRYLLVIFAHLALLTSMLDADIEMTGQSLESSSGNIFFDPDDDSVNEAVINADVNLGLGTLTPLQRLHVSGNGLLSGSIYFSQISSAPAASSGNGSVYVLSDNLFFKDSNGEEINLSAGANVFTVSGEDYVINPGSLSLNIATPEEALHVGGNLLLQPSNSNLAKGKWTFQTLGESLVITNGEFGAANDFLHFDKDGQLYVNRAGANFDFVVEGDADPNSLYVDGGEDAVGIGYSGGEMASTTGKLLVDGRVGINITDPDAMLELYPTGTGIKGLHIKAFSGQTADLLNITDSSDANLSLVDNEGNFGIRSTAIGSGNALVVGGNAMFTGNVFPGNHNSWDLASSTNAWRAVYATDFVTTSDRRLKEEIKSLESGVSSVMKMRPVTFQWKDKNKSLARVGLIAQEVKEVMPELVSGDQATTLGVRYGDIVSVLIKAVQEQQKALEEQSKIISAQNERLKALEENSKE